MPAYVKTWVILAVSAVCLTAAYAGVENGAADLVLYGGKSGNVPFPHHRHQVALANDCQICHTLFDQVSGSIDAMKAEGRLKRKQVMNKQCTKCHKQRKRSGQSTGPVTCKTCHIKKKG